jgi:hypothetical protein
MRLDFNILWVEDQPAAVGAQKDRIAILLRKEGFKLQTEFAKSVDEAKTYLSSDIFGDHIDLILMDYDLGAGPKGDDGLVEVRHKFEYKDIIFYSAQTSQLLEKVVKKHLQGVFCSSRSDLPDTVVGVFDALVKKVLDIDHCRGIVMGASSDIDHLINLCLTATFESSDEGARKATIKLVGEQMKEIRKDFEKIAKAVEEVTHVDKLFDKHLVYTSSHRLSLLRKTLKASQQYSTECESMKDYAVNTAPKRNDLAHVRVVRSGFSRKLIDRHNKELTTDEMRTLRVNLLNHFEKFETLESVLSAALKAAGSNVVPPQLPPQPKGGQRSQPE